MSTQECPRFQEGGEERRKKMRRVKSRKGQDFLDSGPETTTNIERKETTPFIGRENKTLDPLCMKGQRLQTHIHDFKPSTGLIEISRRAGYQLPFPRPEELKQTLVDSSFKRFGKGQYRVPRGPEHWQPGTCPGKTDSVVATSPRR